MDKKSLAGYKFTPDLSEAIEYLKSFGHQEGLTYEINIHGSLKDFHFPASKVVVRVNDEVYYKFDFSTRCFAAYKPEPVELYFAYWEQIALYQYLHAFPNIPSSWPEAERKIRARRGDPLKALREAWENHAKVEIIFGE